MLITLSPAKILDFKLKDTKKKYTIPLFEKETIGINRLLKSLSITEVIDLMKVNPQLAQNTLECIHSFETSTTQGQAIFVYNGIAYQGLAAESLSDDDLNFAQKHLIILSGMYGMLRPLDIIKPYRLEMQTKLKNERGKDLYAFWREILSNQMAKLMSEDDNVWLNLSSKEYDKVIDRKLLPKGHCIITPVFKEADGNNYKQVVVYAKKARGMMARFVIQNKIKEPEYIKAFDIEGYGYSEQLSNDREWVFIR